MLVKMTAANLTKWMAWGRVVVKTIHGYNNNGASVYIQLHQEPVLTAGDVPACASLQCFANDGFMFSFGTQGIELSELIVGMSSTEANYTAVGAGAGLDVTFDIDTQFACDGTETIVGDLTTGQNTLQVWTEATGATAAQRLLRVDIKDNQNVAQLVGIVYAVDSVQVYSLPQANWQPTKNAVSTVFFGDAQGGLSPFQQDAFTQYNAAFANPASPPAIHRGCTINISSLTNGYWTPGSLWGGTSPNVRAIFKPV